MRFSLIIAAHNEGACLWQTVRSCLEGLRGARDYEIVVADDASWDGSVAETLERFPQVRAVRHDQRRGTSPTKDSGARSARGDVLVFLDGHTHPEAGAIARLVEDVELLGGEAIVTPAVPQLDAKRWRNGASPVGHGYRSDLATFECGWLPLGELKAAPQGPRKFYESPALMGCALAVSRVLYDELWGFDPHMRSWGVEDLDFGLKCWLMGRSILHDPEAVVGHRFRRAFDNYRGPYEHLLVNQLRTARKNFTHGVWAEWLDHCRQRHAGPLAGHPEGLWAHAWQLFQEQAASAESERAYLQSRRVRDEFWYAERFALGWPRIGSRRGRADESPALACVREFAASPSPCPTCGKPAEINCPPETWQWTSLMDKRHWYHFKDGNKPWNWVEVPDDVWRVRIQEPPPAPPGSRSKYDLMTYCCFSDFNLKLEFRCPDVRNTWKKCADPLLGVRNWGNSGIYIFNSYEVQIHDSYKGPDGNPDTNVPAAGKITLAFNPSVAGGPGCAIDVVELCGAVYKKRQPNVNLVKKAVGDPPNGDEGTWNTLEIGFMAPRYDPAQNNVKVRNATVTVKINTTDPNNAAFVAFGIDGPTGSGYKEGHWGKLPDNRYVGQGWVKDRGPIVLQEHDNRVEFRNITINPGWYPTIDGVPQGEFDTEWQRSPE